jgi:putative ubiquitin-RnfH superfamily antitoxin RatB of RatAB toxin-antitoxin module
MAESTQKLAVEVAYAKPEAQVIIPIEVEQGTTVQQAIELSGILEQFPEIDLKQNKFGVFGKIAKGDTELRDRDRVEIYRPLIADPKESRRRRAAKKEKQADDSNEAGEG